MTSLRRHGAQHAWSSSRLPALTITRSGAVQDVDCCGCPDPVACTKAMALLPGWLDVRWDVGLEVAGLLGSDGRGACFPSWVLLGLVRPFFAGPPGDMSAAVVMPTFLHLFRGCHTIALYARDDLHDIAMCWRLSTAFIAVSCVWPDCAGASKSTRAGILDVGALALSGVFWAGYAHRTFTVTRFR